MDTSTVSSQRVATVTYDDQSHQVTVVPLAEGEVIVQCRDICLASADEVIAIVMVAGIHSLGVQVLDKVQLGSSIQAFVKVLDRRDKPFTVEQHRYAVYLLLLFTYLLSCC